MSQVDEAQPVCISCGTELSGTAHFCAKCGAPADAFAVTGPFETIQARGWSYQTAQQPRNFVVFLGAWLIWGPFLVISCVSLLTTLIYVPELLFHQGTQARAERFLALLFLGMSGVGTYVCGTYLLRTTRYYLQHRNDPPLDENDDELSDVAADDSKDENGDDRSDEQSPSAET